MRYFFQKKNSLFFATPNESIIFVAKNRQ